jgi:hypothetical protein
MTYCSAVPSHALYVPRVLQEKEYIQPQVFLAQRLLTDGVPPAVSDRLEDLSANPSCLGTW